MIVLEKKKDKGRMAEYHDNLVGEKYELLPTGDIRTRQVPAALGFSAHGT